MISVPDTLLILVVFLGCMALVANALFLALD